MVTINVPFVSVSKRPLRYLAHSPRKTVVTYPARNRYPWNWGGKKAPDQGTSTRTPLCSFDTRNGYWQRDGANAPPLTTVLPKSKDSLRTGIRNKSNVFGLPSVCSVDHFARLAKLFAKANYAPLLDSRAPKRDVAEEKNSFDPKEHLHERPSRVQNRAVAK